MRAPYHSRAVDSTAPAKHNVKKTAKPSTQTFVKSPVVLDLGDVEDLAESDEELVPDTQVDAG